MYIIEIRWLTNWLFFSEIQKIHIQSVDIIPKYEKLTKQNFITFFNVQNFILIVTRLSFLYTRLA